MEIDLDFDCETETEEETDDRQIEEKEEREREEEERMKGQTQLWKKSGGRVMRFIWHSRMCERTLNINIIVAKQTAQWTINQSIRKTQSSVCGHELHE